MASNSGLPSSLNSSSTDNSKPEGEVTVKKERKDDHDTTPKPISKSSQATPRVSSQATSSTKVSAQPPVENKGPPPLDFASIRGVFGWMTVGDVNLPFIVRGDQKYVAVRMVECKIISKYSDLLPWAVFTCTNIKSYYITDNEAKLLNEINGYHCDHQFGYSNFSTKDVVVSVEDAVRFQRFLAVCKIKLLPSNGSSSLYHACGLLKVHGAIVPYLTKNGMKVVPVTLLKEGVIATKQCYMSGVDDWDLAYIKVMCYVAGIDIQNRVVVGGPLCLVNDLRYTHSGSAMHLEEWWPSTFQQYLTGPRMPSNNIKMPSTMGIGVVQEAHSKQMVGSLNGFSRNPVMPEVSKLLSRPPQEREQYIGQSNDYRSSATLTKPCGCIGNCSHYLSMRGGSVPLCNNMMNGSIRAVPAEGYWEAPSRHPSSHGLPHQMTNAGASHAPASNSQLYGEQMLQAYHNRLSSESSLGSKSYPPPPPLVRLGKSLEEQSLPQPMSSPTGDRTFHGSSVPSLRPPPPLQPAPSVCMGKSTAFQDTRTDMPVIVGIHSLASEGSNDPAAVDGSGRNHKDQQHLSPKPQNPVIAPPHYPTPPQSSPLQVSTTPTPVSLTESNFQPPFILHSCDFVDLCSPPVSPDNRNTALQDSVAAANRLPPLLPFIDIEGSLLPTVSLDPTKPTSPLLTSISAVVTKLFPSITERSCQFVLENVLGVKLYNTNRYHSLSSQDKMIAVSDLKSYLPHLRYMFQKVELSPDILKNRNTDDEPSHKRLCHEGVTGTS